MPLSLVEKDEPTPLGRPRDPRTDAAIRKATLELLRRQGYNRLSIDAVARRSGVARTTIYRRWPSKAHLVHEAVFPEVDASLIPDSGNFAADLRALVTGTIATFSRPEVLAAAPGLMAEFRADPELHARLSARIDAQARVELQRLVDRAHERGELRAGMDADTLLDVIAGTVLYGLLVSRRALDDGFAESLVNLLVQATST